MSGDGGQYSVLKFCEEGEVDRIGPSAAGASSGEERISEE